jgi:hypothetical protein
LLELEIPVTRMSDDLFDPEFERMLRGDDELGAVLCAHIYLECQLIELLRAYVRDDKYLERLGLDYSQRVHLAIAMGLKVQYAPVLLAYGTLRNAFAHRPGTKLDATRMKNLYEALSPTDKEVVQRAYKRTHAQLSSASHIPFAKLDPREKFILISMALSMVLGVAIREVWKHRIE